MKMKMKMKMMDVRCEMRWKIERSMEHRNAHTYIPFGTVMPRWKGLIKGCFSAALIVSQKRFYISSSSSSSSFLLLFIV